MSKGTVPEYLQIFFWTPIGPRQGMTRTEFKNFRQTHHNVTFTTGFRRSQNTARIPFFSDALMLWCSVALFIISCAVTIEWYGVRRERYWQFKR